MPLEPVLVAVERADSASSVQPTDPAQFEPVQLDAKPADADHDFLSADDQKRYRRILAAEVAGDRAAADREIAHLTDTRLMGHVLARRYLKTGKEGQASYAELAGWLALYADHAEAADIYRLAVKKHPAGAPEPDKPAAGPAVVLSEPISTAAMESAASRVGSTNAGIVVLRQRSAAMEAAHAFFAGEDAASLAAAEQSAFQKSADAAAAGWYGGLAAWRQNDMRRAAKFFEAALAGATEPAHEAASAFWAARAYTRLKDPDAARPLLERAAQRARTSFYGLLAARALGQPETALAPVAQKLAQRHLKRLAQEPAGFRAVALLEVGDRPEAERELLRIAAPHGPGGDRGLTEALAAVAEGANLTNLMVRLATASGAGGALGENGLYPVPPWAPKGGFTVDRALIYALARQESRFDPDAHNGSGAAGLLQLMPGTASRAAGQHVTLASLLDPETNLTIGQKYVRSLLADGDAGSDLISLAIAYNAGAGRIAKWKAAPGAGDALMYLESIPVEETRAFARQVLAGYWVYQMRLGQGTPSLTQLAKGNWPKYAPAGGVTKVATAG